MSAKKPATKSAKTAKPTTFSDAEKAAMKERAKELKAEARKGNLRKLGEKDLLASVKKMPTADREMAEKIHAIVSKNAPHLMPKTWYGMPAYANEAGKVVCFFKAASKFDARYAELGFNEAAALDEGVMWPTVFALTKMNKQVEQQIRALVTQAAS